MKNIHRINGNIYITNDEEIKDGEYVVESTTSPRNPYIGKTFYPKNDGTVTDEILKKYLLSVNYKGHYETFADKYTCKKIILTTDTDLIKDGVQAIDDEFLEWFVKNPSCEVVETRYSYPTIDDEGDGSISEGYWLLVIPEENKIYRECPNGCRGKLSYLNKDECLCSCGTKWNIKTNKIIIPKEETPEQHLELINNNIEEFDKAIESFRQRKYKQETLEEVAEIEIYKTINQIIDGGKNLPKGVNVSRAQAVDYAFKIALEVAKWQQQNKNLYSEEELLRFAKSCFYKGFDKAENDDANCYTAFREEISSLFEQFKKK